MAQAKSRVLEKMSGVMLLRRWADSYRDNAGVQENLEPIFLGFRSQCWEF